MSLRQMLSALFLLALAVLGGSRVFANVDLLYFRAESSSDRITLVWETETELDNLGFNLWRSQTGNPADAVQINPTLIPSQVGGQPTGALYEYPDNNVQEQVTYSYWLESVDMNGTSERHGPVQAALGGGSPISTPPPGGSNLPEPTRTTAPQPTNTPPPNTTISTTNEPAATRPNPTATSAGVSAGPTAAPTLAINNTVATNSAPPGATAPAGIAQPTQSFVSGAAGQPAAGATLPTTPAEMPNAPADSPAVASNDSAAPAKPTATFIAGQELAAVGEQGAAASASGEETIPVEAVQPGDNWRNTAALSTLIIGLFLTAGGGFALWFLGRRDAESHD